MIDDHKEIKVKTMEYILNWNTCLQITRTIYLNKWNDLVCRWSQLKYYNIHITLIRSIHINHNSWLTLSVHKWKTWVRLLYFTGYIYSFKNGFCFPDNTHASSMQGTNPLHRHDNSVNYKYQCTLNNVYCQLQCYHHIYI